MFLGSMSNIVIRGSRSRCLNQPRFVPPLIQKDLSLNSNQTGTISTVPSLRLVPMSAGKTSWVNACIFALSSTPISDHLPLEEPGCDNHSDCQPDEDPEQICADRPERGAVDANAAQRVSHIGQGRVLRDALQPCRHRRPGKEHAG